MHNCIYVKCPVETESREVFFRGWGRGVGRRNEKWILLCMRFLWGVENVVKLDCDDSCTNSHYSVTILKTTDLYTFQGWILQWVSESCSVMSDSLRPPGLFNQWNSPGQNTGVVAFPFSRVSCQPRDWTQVSHMSGRFFTNWATRKAREYWCG